jgi:hypothetical protein
MTSRNFQLPEAVRLRAEIQVGEVLAEGSEGLVAERLRGE